jgi:hypothetical protein
MSDTTLAMIPTPTQEREWHATSGGSSAKAFYAPAVVTETDRTSFCFPDRVEKDRFEFLDIIVATLAQELNIQRRSKP